MRREVTRPQFALLLGGYGEKDNGSLRLHVSDLHQPRDLDHARDAGRVVHRSVVDAVAVHRPSDTLMVEVRRHDYVFVFQLPVGAWQKSHHIGGLHFAAMNRRFRLQYSLERETRERLVRVRQFLDLLESVARSFEELLSAGTPDHDDDLLPGCLLERRISQRDGHLRTAASVSATRGCPISARSAYGVITRSSVRSAASGNGGNADGPGSLERRPAFGARGIMRFHGSRSFHRTAGIHVDSNLAFQVDTREAVILRLGNHQAVADEDHGRFHLRHKIAARAHVA
jgi:hypothetical protein